MTNDIPDYLTARVEDQIAYFDKGALSNQKRYRLLKSIAIFSNVLTTMAIALAFTVPQEYKSYLSITALVLSALVLFTYQWEEFHNYGAKWEKFRLVAEQLRSEKFLFTNCAGPYSDSEMTSRHRRFVESVESIIRGTDISYFALMVEPGKRIERRLDYTPALGREDKPTDLHQD